VVLANGEVIQTGRLTKRELNKKLGLATFEGEIYRSVDKLYEEHHELIHSTELHVSKNTAGYDLADVKHNDGSIDLTPLFIGSQGTLGIITEITLDTEEYNPASTLLIAAFEGITELTAALGEFAQMSERPCALEIVDDTLVSSVRGRYPNLLKNIIEEPYPKFVLLAEFDDDDRAQKKAVKRARRIFEQHSASYREETDLEKQNELWKIRHLSGVHSVHNEGSRKPVPLIEDGVVPREKFAEYLEKLYQLLGKNSIETGLWGHAGDASVHLQPLFDLSQIGDRQKAFKLLEEYNQLIIQLGGTTSGESGDGRLRAPYLRQLYGNQVYEIFEKIKAIFDPYGILNPGVKMGVTLEDIKPLVRGEYNHKLYDHLPRN
jgi:FAD/FMN-containing dehydrogenase